MSVANGTCRGAIAALLLCTQFTSRIQAQNFVGADSELLAAAESARVRSAVYWSGSELPGRWSVACPILVTPAGHSGGGRTNFQFAGGEVFGWTMSISGARANLLADVIPHEVDHMVRASLVRRPLERWLDEGCASLWESPAVHARLRDEAARFPASQLTETWLAARDYPPGSRQQAEVYAVGFSLVEFLLSRKPPEVLLAFQRDVDGVAPRLARRYELTVDELRNEWSAWRILQPRDCAACGCPLHAPRGIGVATGGSREFLWIWSADWCPPCRQFEADLDTVPGFRAALESRFELREIDHAAQPVQAALQGVTGLPTFQWSGGRIVGYTSPEGLLRSLGVPWQVVREEPSPDVNAPDVDAAVPPVQEPADIAPAASNPDESPEPPHERLALRGTWWSRLIPLTFTALQWTGVLGGTFATGGLGGIALAAGWSLLRRRWSRRLTTNGTSQSVLEEGAGSAGPAPFPRQLDEARELHRLRKSEGRVAVLDALRGMFLDDELDKLAARDSAAAATIKQLRDAIDARVNEVAPLSTKIES